MILEWMKWMVRSGTVWLVLVASALYAAYEVVRPEEPSLTAGKEQLLDRFSSDLQARLQQVRVARGGCVIAGLDRDDFGRVTDAARKVVLHSDLFDLKQRSIEEKFRRRIQWTVPTMATREAAVRYGARRKADYVVRGRVDQFRDIAGRAELSGEIIITSIASGEDVLVYPFRVERSGVTSLAAPGEKGAGATGWIKGAGLRLIGWLLFVILFPLPFFGVIKRVVLDGSNWVILLTLLILTAAGLAAARILFGWGGVGQMILLLLAAGISFGYNWRFMDLIKTSSE